MLINLCTNACHAMKDGAGRIDIGMTEVRSIRPDLPVVIFSGYVTDELRADALRAGMREVVSKANTVDEMCQSIRQFLAVETGRA